MKTKNKTKRNIKSPPYEGARIFTLMAILMLLCFCPRNICAQTIPANFFGINHWMPDQIPVGSNYPDGRADCPNMQTLVANAGVKFVRIGGGNSTDGYDYFGTDWNGTSASNNCYMAAIDAVGVTNADFLIQVPFSSGITPTQAGTMVQRLKDEYLGKVFYYAIGNEWDAYINTIPTPDRKYLASEIAALIKDYSAAMKTVDPTIKIVAPALTYYGAYDGNSPAVQIMPILLSGNGSASDITVKVPGQSYYYIDVVDFHTYAGGSNGDMSGIFGNYSTYRTNSIAYPSGGFATNLSSLQSLISTANANNRTSPSSPLTYAITEMNIDWKNPPFTVGTDEGSTDPNRNTVFSLGPRSFFAGQYWADMFSEILENGTPSTNAKVEFVNPWSINESSGDGSSFDLSMTKGTMATCNDPVPQPLSTYWHYQIIAENFTGGSTYFPNTYGSTGANYKALVCTTATEIRVLIMNQNEQSSPRGFDNTVNTFKIDFNGGTPSGSDMLFSFSTGNSATYTGGLQSGIYTCSIQKETSMFLSFNKTTGALINNQVYSLQDALRPNDVGPNTWIGGTGTVNTQGIYDAYNSTEVYTDISIGTATGITAGSNKVFQFTNSATITGPFSSGTVGTTLSILPTTEMTCH